MKDSKHNVTRLRGLLIPLLAAVMLAPVIASTNDAKEIVKDWPKEAQKAAGKMMSQYGKPSEATDSMLVWHENGPWKRTIVYKEEIQHDFPIPHKDVLEQFIDYEVPADKFNELAEYDGSVIAERTKGEISARCDKEGANFLALNLANDIVTDKRSVDDARAFYAETIQEVMRGEKPEYTAKLHFEVSDGDTADPDQSYKKSR